MPLFYHVERIDPKPPIPCAKSTNPEERQQSLKAGTCAIAPLLHRTLILPRFQLDHIYVSKVYYSDLI
jgi:hypothetical protein